MQHQGRFNFLLFFLVLLCVSLKASARYKISHRRRSVQGRVNSNGHGDVCADIIGPNWNIKKQGKSPCKTLVVWVPKKTGFTEFVKVNEHNEVEGGFSIAIFCYVLQKLPFNVQPIFKPFVNDTGQMNGTYDQLLKHIENRAFARGSPLLQIFSEAVINVTESKTMMDMKRRYLGSSTLDKSQPSPALPQSLDVQSFIGLFIFMGIVMIVAIIVSEISLFEKNNKVQDHDEEEEEKPKELTTIYVNK